MILIYTAIISFLFVWSFIKLANEFGWGKSIRQSGPKSHISKEGTATMGGIAFLAASALGVLILGEKSTANLAILTLTLAAALVGFYDDFLSLQKKHKIAHGEDASTGLLARYRLLGQAVFALIFAVYAANTGHIMFGNYYLDILGFSFVIMAMINALNFTDGLDGLSSGVSIIILFFFISNDFAKALIGALLGFIWFNSRPAKIFMGGVGSEALGAAIAAIAILSDKVWYLPFIAIIPVLEMLSVIIQVVYFRATHGKRIFKMAPLHHHFELSGWQESKIVFRFFIITAVAVVACSVFIGKL